MIPKNDDTQSIPLSTAQRTSASVDLTGAVTPTPQTNPIDLDYSSQDISTIDSARLSGDDKSLLGVSPLSRYRDPNPFC
jgi:hypothetical protein